MKISKKGVAIGCSILLLTASLTAYNTYVSANSGSGISTGEKIINKLSETLQASSTQYGKVTAIDGSKITLSLGQLSGGKMGGPSSSSDGNTIEDTTDSDSTKKPPENGTNPGGKAPSENTNESSTKETQSGEAPSSQPSAGGMGAAFTENGKSLTLTLTNKSVIKIQKGSEVSTGSLSDIAVGTILSIEYATDGTLSTVTIWQEGEAPQGGSGSGSGSSSESGSESGSETGSITLSGVYTVDGTDETSTDETYKATESNQNAVLVKNSGSLTITGATLSKTGDTTSEDESNFYGVNSILAAIGASTVTISDSTLTSAADGANAIFSTGDDSKITVSGVTIKTTGNSSRGLDATYGGTVIADDVTITTTGDHCAPVATDRGEGTIEISDSTLKSAGDGSPCIYSTGDITASNVTGTATGSQAAVVEGKNTITLTDCDLTGAGKNGIMLYQSTSGDAAEGTCVFSATDSTLSTTSTGEMFYITNTDAEINLTSTVLDFTSGILLNAAGNSTNNWGTPGSNGADVTLNASDQELEGDITCDSISTVAISLEDDSTLTGTIDADNTGDVSITLDSSSTWNVTGDSYITSLTNEDDTLSNIESNGYTIYYDSSNDDNSWLDGETVTLSDGGTLTPME